MLAWSGGRVSSARGRRAGASFPNSHKAAPCAPAWCPATHRRVPGDRGQQSWHLLMTPVRILPAVLVHTGSSSGASTSLGTLGFLQLEEATGAGREPGRRARPQPLGRSRSPWSSCLALLGTSGHRGSSCPLAESRGLPELQALDLLSEAKEIQAQAKCSGLLSSHGLVGPSWGPRSGEPWRRAGSKGEKLESPRHGSWFPVKRRQAARDCCCSRRLCLMFVFVVALGYPFPQNNPDRPQDRPGRGFCMP